MLWLFSVHFSSLEKISGTRVMQRFHKLLRVVTYRKQKAKEIDLEIFEVEQWSFDIREFWKLYLNEKLQTVIYRVVALG